MPQKQSATGHTSSSSLLSFAPRSVVIGRLSMTAANGATATTKLDNKTLVLQAIYRYLKTNGFSKTVRKLKSEAKLDEDEITDTLLLDLEVICSKHLKKHTHAIEAPVKSVKDLKSNGNAKTCNEEDSSFEKVSKKKKKVKNDAGEDESGLTTPDVKPTTDVIPEPVGKMKEKKKRKKSSDIINQEVMAKDIAPKGESETDTEKKKKKKKLGTMTDVTTENDEKNSYDAASEKQHKSKNKKSNNDVEDSPIETKESKKRKRASAEDDDVKVVGASLDNESKHTKTEEPNGEESNARKAETKLFDSNPINEVTNLNSDDKSIARKSTKKPRNGSAEPTTIKAFQRVKVEEVVITDERLKDNSYWAKDGAESGYGAKAQEILGQVRGKDFRHEKTKKKRGSYKGGQIDFNSHSIKFNDSDDE